MGFRGGENLRGGFVEDRVKVLASCWQVAASSSSSSRMVWFRTVDVGFRGGENLRGE